MIKWLCDLQAIGLGLILIENFLISASVPRLVYKLNDKTIIFKTKRHISAQGRVESVFKEGNVSLTTYSTHSHSEREICCHHFKGYFL